MISQEHVLEIAVAGARWNQARLSRIEADKRYRKAEKECAWGIGSSQLRSELEDARRIERRSKHLLIRACEKARKKPKEFEIIDI